MRAAITRLSAVLVAALVVGLTAGSALAHNMPTSAVLLDVQSHQVAGELQLPLDRLSVALHEDVTPAGATGALRTQIERYAAAHIRATGTDGGAWRVAVGDAHVETIAGVRDVVLSLTLTPPGGKVTDFDLRYDVITEQLVTHKAIATLRTQFEQGTTARDPVALGVLDWNHQTLRVDADGGSWLRGVVASAGLGVTHIGQGADHLLFLLTLLIPAPLVARRRRWRRRDDAKASAWRVVHVVTAFAIGHSMTLALATLGVVHVPSRVVESLIALSILVSAIHAIRPLVPGGESRIALAFGLVHGLAFATLLGDLGLSGGALASALLGFNLGIEVTQLLVVALLMPSLYVLSRTRIYGVLRVVLAGAAAVLAGAWLLERTTLIGSDPFAAVSTALVEHPFGVAAAFALAALAANVLPNRTATTTEPIPS